MSELNMLCEPKLLLPETRANYDKICRLDALGERPTLSKVFANMDGVTYYRVRCVFHILRNGTKDEIDMMLSGDGAVRTIMDGITLRRKNAKRAASEVVSEIKYTTYDQIDEREPQQAAPADTSSSHIKPTRKDNNMSRTLTIYKVTNDDYEAVWDALAHRIDSYSINNTGPDAIAELFLANTEPVAMADEIAELRRLIRQLTDLVINELVTNKENNNDRIP